MLESLDVMKRRNNMIKNHKNYLKLIKTSIHNILPNSIIYLFGSILENKLVAGSDIDILIIADVPKKHLTRAEIIAEIEEEAKLPYIHPFNFHLLTQEELNDWSSIYKLKIKDIREYL